MQQRPLSDTECATKLQALVRGFLLRKDCYMEYNDFKSASSKGFPQRIYVHAKDLQRINSAVSAITMYDSDRSLFTFYEDGKDEHPGFAGNDSSPDLTSPVRCPRRIASKESNSSYMVTSSRLLTLEEDEEHPGFGNQVPEGTSTPVKQPTRALSKEVAESCDVPDESSLLFSPTSVNAAFGSPKSKKMSMLSFSPLPFARGQRALARRQASRQSAPAKMLQDRPMIAPRRQMSTDGASVISSGSSRRG